MGLRRYILAFDSSSDELALALGVLEDAAVVSLVASCDGPAPRMADQVLLPRAKELLESQGLNPSDLAGVVVGRGPGSFTGVRIGIATAKGIACASACPAWGVGTLDAIAWRLWRSGVRGAVGVVQDAMRKEVYPARFDLTDQGAIRREVDRVAKPADVAREWAQAREPLLVAGNGLSKHAACFDGALFTLLPVDDAQASGQGLLDAFASQLARGSQGSGDAATLLPVYTRLSDAEEAERIRLSLADEMSASGVAEQRAGGVMLRPMSLNDCHAVVELQQRAMPEDAWTYGKVADEVGRSDRSWWVAVSGGEVVGCAGGQTIAGELCIFNVCVDEGQRRKYIAARLLGRVATDGRALGAETVTLEVRCDNAAAIALYHALGLEDVGVRPRYYHDGSDALIMRGALPLRRLKSEQAKSAPVRGQHAANGSPVRHVKRPLILAIESSCDETAASVVDANRVVLADQIASQIDFHSRFGGVVPEIASRKHTEAIVAVVMEALGEAGIGFSDLDAIAVTQGPGLVGALVVGLAFAKGASFASGVPLIGVNHLEGHLYANRFTAPDLEPPFVALLVSGGHTMLVHVKAWGSYEVLGSTLDDAVGEAFDKVAKALGLGYPGGPVISRLAAQGNPAAIDFPRAMMHSGDLRFSLSGLKTAVVTYINKLNEAGEPVNVPDLCASFQQAVVDVQVSKAWTACKQTGVKAFCMGGGVAANPVLRASLSDFLGRRGVRVIVPDPHECTDNASMIASAALDLYADGLFTGLDADPIAHMPLRS